MKDLFYIFFISFLIISNSNAQIPEIGLIAYYPFNSNANDHSGNCINGITNGVTSSDDRFGRPNSCYFFNGTIENYIYVPNASSLQTNQYTYSIWCYLESLPDLNSSFFIMSNGGAIHDQIINAINHTSISNGWNASGYNKGIPNQYILNSNLDLETNKWTHYVVTRSSNGMKLYINGTLEAIDTTTYNLTPDYGDPEIFIGMRGNSTYPFYGKIDDLRIYNRAVSDKEVKDLFNEQICTTFISVTDTLFINTNITSFNPVMYDIHFKAYPNPTHDHLIIDFEDISKLTNYSIKINNSAGLTVFASTINNQILDIDMNKWKGKGLFFLNLYDSKSNLLDVKKIILQ